MATDTVCWLLSTWEAISCRQSTRDHKLRCKLLVFKRGHALLGKYRLESEWEALYAMGLLGSDQFDGIIITNDTVQASFGEVSMNSPFAQHLFRILLWQAKNTTFGSPYDFSTPAYANETSAMTTSER
jgi:hypothetical protein